MTLPHDIDGRYRAIVSSDPKRPLITDSCITDKNIAGRFGCTTLAPGGWLGASGAANPPGSMPCGWGLAPMAWLHRGALLTTEP